MHEEGDAERKRDKEWHSHCVITSKTMGGVALEMVWRRLEKTKICERKGQERCFVHTCLCVLACVSCRL